MTLVQSTSATGTGTITATWPGATTSNNLLWCGFATNDGTFTNPTGYVTDEETYNPDEDDIQRQMSKLGSGSETTTVITVTNSGMLAVAEFDDNNTTAGYKDTSAETGRQPGVTSISSGTATPSQTKTISLVLFSVRSGGTPLVSPALSNSFNTLFNLIYIPGSSPTGFSGYKLETASGTRESTLSWSTTGYNSMGSVVVYKGLVAAGGAGPIVFGGQIIKGAIIRGGRIVQ